MGKFAYRDIVSIIGCIEENFIDINWYIDKNNLGEIVFLYEVFSAASWAKKNRIEFAAFKPNYEIFKDNALLECYKSMVDFSDKVIFFWDGKDCLVKEILYYTIERKIPYSVHIIESRD